MEECWMCNGIDSESCVVCSVSSTAAPSTERNPSNRSFQSIVQGHHPQQHRWQAWGEGDFVAGAQSVASVERCAEVEQPRIEEAVRREQEEKRRREERDAAERQRFREALHGNGERREEQQRRKLHDALHNRGGAGQQWWREASGTVSGNAAQPQLAAGCGPQQAAEWHIEEERERQAEVARLEDEERRKHEDREEQERQQFREAMRHRFDKKHEEDMRKIQDRKNDEEQRLEEAVRLEEEEQRQREEREELERLQFREALRCEGERHEELHRERFQESMQNRMSKQQCGTTGMVKPLTYDVLGNNASRDSQGMESDEVLLKEGAYVRISGLKMKSAQPMNGQEGTLQRYDEAAGRWVIRLHNGGMKKLRPANLFVCQPPDPNDLSKPAEALVATQMTGAPREHASAGVGGKATPVPGTGRGGNRAKRTEDLLGTLDKLNMLEMETEYKQFEERRASAKSKRVHDLMGVLDKLNIQENEAGKKITGEKSVENIQTLTKAKRTDELLGALDKLKIQEERVLQERQADAGKAVPHTSTTSMDNVLDNVHSRVALLSEEHGVTRADIPDVNTLLERLDKEDAEYWVADGSAEAPPKNAETSSKIDMPAPVNRSSGEAIPSIGELLASIDGEDANDNSAFFQLGCDGDTKAQNSSCEDKSEEDCKPLDSVGRLLKLVDRKDPRSILFPSSPAMETPKGVQKNTGTTSGMDALFWSREGRWVKPNTNDTNA